MNVLFITIDQWRADWLGANGNTGVETPNLDRLANSGTLFQKHFTCSAPCGPSRATLHTGMYPSNHRAISNGTPLNAHLTNLAKEARKQGYEPTLFGYTDITADPRYKDPGDPDVKTYEGVLDGYFVGARLNEHCKAWLSDLISKGYDVTKAGYDIYHPDPEFKLPPDRHMSYAPSRFKAADSETAWLTDRTLEFLQAQFGDPFFCHLSYLRPHPPFIAPPEYHDRYQPADMEKPIDFGDVKSVSEVHPFLNLALETIQQSTFMMSEKGLTKDLTEHEVRQIRATYSALVSEVDANIGRILDMLEKTGEMEKTLIVVTADHGEQMGDHHLFGKLGFYDQSFHIPLIIKAPQSMNIEASVRDEFTESIDLMPTILECLGAKVPAQCDGKSLLPLMRAEVPDDWRDAVHWLFDFRDIEDGVPEAALGLDHNECNLLVYRDRNFKYVHFVSLPPLLFDLINDPNETRNLAEEPDYQAIVLDYAQKLLSWRMKNEFGALDRYVVSDEGQMIYGA